MFLFSEDANEASTEQQQQILPSSIQHAVPLSDALPHMGILPWIEDLMLLEGGEAVEIHTSPLF